MELRGRISRSMRGSKKGILLTLLTIVLFILMLGELLTYVVININYSNIASQTASVFSTGNAAANLDHEIYSFLHSSLENSLNSLITFESTPSLRKDNFTSNADGALTSLILDGSVYGHRLVESNLSSFIKSLIKQAGTQNIALAITNQSVSVYQSSPFTVSVQYTALATVNSSGGSFTYPLNVTASASLTGKTNLLSAEEGMPYTVYKSASYPQAYTIGPQALAGSRSPYMFVYGKIIYESGTGSATCSGISSSLETPNNILAVYNATHINQNVCGFGGLLTNLPNSTTPLKPYLVYSGSSIPSQIQAENNQYALLDGPALSLLNISAFNNSINQGYTYASPYAKSYLQQASNLSVGSSPYGAFSFSPLQRQTPEFDGYNSNISVPNSPALNPTSEVTVSAWIDMHKYSSNGRNGAGIIAKSTQYEISINASGDAVIDGAMPITPVYSNTIVPLNKWVLITGMLNIDGTATICVDSTCTSRTGSSESSLATSSNPLYIGYGTISVVSSYFNGSMADAQIYDTALTIPQVAYLYQEGINGHPLSDANLAGWWPLNGNANDYSGNNNNGTPTNVAYTNIYNYQGNPILGFNTHQYNTSPIYGLGCNSIYLCNQSALGLSDLPITSGKIANFNGQDGTTVDANTGTQLLHGNTSTMAVWVKWKSGEHYIGNCCGSRQEILGADSSFSNEVNPIIAVNDSGTDEADSWVCTSVNCWVEAKSAANAIKTNTWYFLVSRYNGTDLSLWINGTQVAESAVTGDLSPEGSGNNIYIGSRGDDGSFFNGSIVNAQIYNKSLSASDIQALYREGINGKPISDAGLQAWYPLDGNAQDYGPNNYDGVANNVNFTNSSIIQSGALDAFNISKAALPKSIAFNPNGNTSIGAYVNIPNLVPVNYPAFSYFAWVYPTSTGNGQCCRRILATSAGDSGTIEVSMAGNDQLQFNGYNTSGWTGGVGTAMPLNTWNQVGAVYNGSYYTVYQNGVAVWSKDVGALSGHASSGSMDIGLTSAYGISGNQFFGNIADVQFFNTALTPSQVKELYLNNSVAGISPIAYLPLSGGLNNTYNVTPDITGNGFNGYLYGNSTSKMCRSKDVVSGTCRAYYSGI
ncbi:MAG: LamG-like jellyroll fold domain-containing protein [Candidatus Micrarchaeaceae archaeon]